MKDHRQNMTVEELVDILAQKTEKFTRLMIYKNFGDEYKECKEAIQQIIKEIELKKTATTPEQNQQAT